MSPKHNSTVDTIMTPKLDYVHLHITNTCKCKFTPKELATEPFFNSQNILNKNENATLQYFIFCERVVDIKYLLNLNNVSRHPANGSLNLRQFVSFDV